MMLVTLLIITAVCCVAVPSQGQGSSGFLLFTDSSQGFIYKANSQGYGLLSSPKVIIYSSFTPQAVTYDPIDQRVYWSDRFTRTISRAFLNGSSEEVVVRYVRGAVAIAVDSAGRNLYWADNKKGRIEAAKLDGTHRKILVRTTRPTDMALDLTRRQMYWSSDGLSAPVIERSSMDGSDRQVIVSGLIYGTPSGLCLDCGRRVLYWTEKNTPEIFYVSLDNPGGHHYHFQSGSSKPSRMTILDQRIYWTDRGSYYSYAKVASVNITTKTDFRILTNNVARPKGIYAFAGDGGIPIPESNCSRNNGGCSHLCLLNPRQDVCACSSGMALKDDGKTCHYKEFLLVVDDIQWKIFHKSLDDLSHPKAPLALGRSGRIMTVDFDPQEHKVYWTNKRGVISRAFLNGSSVETVVNSDNYFPRGHEIDVIGRNIYWFDSKHQEIGVCKLDGTYQKILMTLNEQPEAMVVDSSKGLVYWVTNNGNTASIKRAQMNGEKREVVLRFPRRYHYYYYSPRALALDSDNNRLYWVDDNRGELCYTETNPKDGLIHNVGISSWYIRSPYSLALKEDYIYWGDGLKSAVYRINKTATGKVKKIVSGVDPVDLHVYHNNTQVLDNNHPCAQYNGWCTHLCLLKPGGYSCVCPRYKGSRPCFTTPVTPTPPHTSSLSKPSSSPTSSVSSSRSSQYLSVMSSTSVYVPYLETSSSVDQARKTTRFPPDHSTILQTSSKHHTTAIASSSPIRLQPESTLEPSMVVSTISSGLYLTTSFTSLVSSPPSPPLSSPLSSSSPPSSSSSPLPSSSPPPPLSSLSSSPLSSSSPPPSSSSSYSSSSSAIRTPTLSSILNSPPPSIKSISSSTTVPKEFKSSVQVLSLYSSRPSSSTSSLAHVITSLPAVLPASTHQVSFTSSRSLLSSTSYPPVSLAAGSVTSVFPRLPVLTSSYMFSSAMNYDSTSFPSSPSSTLIHLSPSLTSFTSSTLNPTNNNLPSPALSTIKTISTTGTSLSPSTVYMTRTTLPSSASIPIKKCHPDCQVGEICVEPWYQCIKIGENQVSLLFKMNQIQWSNDTLKNSISRASTEYCTNQSCLELLRRAESPVRSRRGIKQTIVFKGSDVLVLNHPVSGSGTDDQLLVVIAVLVPSNHESLTTSGTRRVITKQNLCKLIWQARHLINRYMMGSRIIKLDGQTQPSCVDGGNSHEQRQENRKESPTTISVSILGVLVLLLLLFLAMFYIRRRKASKNGVPRPYHCTQISFNNQGFIENDNDYEGVEASFSNPAYAEIDQVLNNKRQSGKRKKLLRTPSVEPVKDTNVHRDNTIFQNPNQFWDSRHHVRPRPRRTGNEVILNPSNLDACADVDFRPESSEYSTPIPVIPRYMPLSSNQATKSRNGDYAHLNPGTRKPSSRERDLPATGYKEPGFHDYESLVGPGTRNGGTNSGSVLRDDYDHLWQGQGTCSPNRIADHNTYDHLCRGESTCSPNRIADHNTYDHLWRGESTCSPNRIADHNTYDHLCRGESTCSPNGLTNPSNIYDHLQRGFVPQQNTQNTLQLEKDDDDVVEETII